MESLLSYSSQNDQSYNPEVYQDYKELPPYPYPENFVLLIRRIGIHAVKSNNRPDLLKSIWDMRRLRKNDFINFRLFFDYFIYDFLNIYIKKQMDDVVIEFSLKFLEEILFDSYKPVTDKWGEEIFDRLDEFIKKTTNEMLRTKALKILTDYLGGTDYWLIIFPLKHLVDISDENELNYWINNLNQFLAMAEPENLMNGVICSNFFADLNKLKSFSDLN